jgi:hypothetical protein
MELAWNDAWTFCVYRANLAPEIRTPQIMNVKRAVCLVGIAILICPMLRPQQSFWDSPDAYLGQPRPSDTPQTFAPGLLTDSGTFTMGRVAFSQYGMQFYYTQSDSWVSGGHAELRMMQYADGHWGKPTMIAAQFMSPTFSIDAQTLYMRKGGMHNVWQSHKKGDTWSAPVPFLDVPFGVYDFMPTNSGNNYVGSEPDADDVKNGSTYAFSVLTISDHAITVKSLGQPLNEPGFNGDLYVAPDESYMIVSAKESKTYESELYLSFHKHDGAWTSPVSLGPKINDGLAHRWGQYVTPDGKYLFYSHGISEKDCAIHWVRFDNLLESLRPKQL